MHSRWTATPLTAGRIALAAAVLTCGAQAASHVPAARPDQVCSGYVEGWRTSDYIDNCSRLIEALRDRGDEVKLAAALNDRARFLMQLRRYRDAIDDLTRAITLSNRRYVLAFRNRGLAYMQQNDFERAESDYTEALELSSRPDRIELIRHVDASELKLGIGFARIGAGRCNFAAAGARRTSAWSTSSDGANEQWLRAIDTFKDILARSDSTDERARTAAAYFGLGLSTRLLGTQRLKAGQGMRAAALASGRKDMASQAAAIAAEGDRMVREGDTLMRNARALYPRIDAVIHDEFGMVASVCGLSS